MPQTKYDVYPLIYTIYNNKEGGKVDTTYVVQTCVEQVIEIDVLNLNTIIHNWKRNCKTILSGDGLSVYVLSLNIFRNNIKHILFFCLAIKVINFTIFT